MKLARELSAGDGLSAQLQLEYGIEQVTTRRSAWGAALRAGAAFLIGSLGPVLAMAWMFAAYLRFRRDCDELERRIELGALAWAAGITLQAAMAAMLLLDAGVAGWSGRHVAAWLCLVLAIAYVLVRGWLHRRYA